MWTVRDLIDELDGYGGHVPVKVRIEKASEILTKDFVVNDTTDNELGVVVMLEVEL